ncbi:MAG TPA: type IX secretion system membrane protein PorP/SprF, partial [Cytophagales bacterium]|nr:type IX secretion system membrane protein PorP/SprF [Cytophagales bacterium]
QLHLSFFPRKKQAYNALVFEVYFLQFVVLLKLDMRKRSFLLIMFLFVTMLLKGQSIPHFNLYSYNYALFNPAAAGADKKHIIAAQGQLGVDTEITDDLKFDYNGLLSYEGNFSPINSGIGAFVVRTGSEGINTMKAGVSYNYKIEFAPSTSLRVGVRPTFTRHTVSFDFALDEEKESSTKTDLDLGLYFNTFGFYVGASMNNILKHKHEFGVFESNDFYSDQLLSVVVGKKINTPVISIDPSLAYVTHDDFSVLYLNSNFVLAKMFMFGGTYGQSLDSEGYNLSANVGMSIVGKVDLIAHVYSRQRHRPETSSDYKFFEGMIRVKI